MLHWHPRRPVPPLARSCRRRLRSPSGGRAEWRSVTSTAAATAAAPRSGTRRMLPRPAASSSSSRHARARWRQACRSRIAGKGAACRSAAGRTRMGQASGRSCVWAAQGRSSSSDAGKARRLLSCRYTGSSTASSPRFPSMEGQPVLPLQPTSHSAARQWPPPPFACSRWAADRDEHVGDSHAEATGLSTSAWETVLAHEAVEASPTAAIGLDSSLQRLGSRRAANARNRAYAIMRKSALEARRPA